MAAQLEKWLAAAEIRTGAFLHTLAFRPYAGVVALTVLCCALFLPGIATLPVTDRDEARFAQASRQMFETGNYIDIRFQDVPRYKKPIGIYWLQAASVAVATKAGAALDDIWAYRIPSFLAALAAVLLTFWAAQPQIGSKSALIAAALFSSSLGLVFEAHIAKSDAALIASIALMQGALFRLYLAPGNARTSGLAALFWLGLGASILIKGPIGTGLAVLTIGVVLVRDKRREWLRNLHWRWGLPLLLGVTLPWFIAIGISSGGAFFKSSLGQDFAGKLQGGQESHWAPPGYYFLLFWWTFWPAALFVTPSAALSLWRSRSAQPVIFLLAWILPFWLLIEAIPTKLPHYALPLYPAMAMAVALALQHAPGDEHKKRYKLNAVVWLGVAALQLTFIVSACFLFDVQTSAALVVLLGIYIVLSFSTFVAARRSYVNVMFTTAMLSAAAFYAAAFGFALPALKPIWLSEQAAAARRALTSCGVGPPAFVGFSEPSTVFLNGTGTILSSPIAGADALAAKGASLVFVTFPHRAEFEQRFAERTGASPRFLGCVDGVDINGRGPTRLQVYTRRGTQRQPGCEPVPETRCADKSTVRWRRLLGSKF